MNSPADLVDQAASGLRELLSAETVALLPDADRMQLLRALGEVQRATEALIVETIASVDEGRAGSGTVTFCSQFGCGSVGELLERALRTDAAGAGRVVKAAKLVRRDVELTTGNPLPARWPHLREALLDGAIGVAGLLAATWPIERAGARIGTEDRLRADADLAGFARGCLPTDDGLDGDVEGGADTAPPATPEDLRLLAQAIAAYLDADGAPPSEERAMNARGVVLGRAKDGVIPIRGTLLPEVAAQLQRIWDAYLNPKVDGPPLPGVRFTPSEAEGTDGDHSDSAGTDDGTLPSGNPGGTLDTRSRSQKQHDALAAALGIAARHEEMPRLGGAAPTLVVSVSAEDYATGRGWARLDGVDTLVSVATARHTACGGTVQRVLFDPEGRIVGIGATERIFTPHQRRAITLRDRECLIPGCHVPSSWCEIHHVQEYARGGPTSTDNGVTLCWHHHRTLETSGWEIRMQNGTPSVRGPAWWDPLRRWRSPRPRMRMPLRA